MIPPLTQRLILFRAFNDPRIKLLLDNHFNSPIFNLENALKHASGDFIFLSDQDDVWKINKVSVMKRYLKAIYVRSIRCRNRK